MEYAGLAYDSRNGGYAGLVSKAPIRIYSISARVTAQMSMSLSMLTLIDLLQARDGSASQ
jgi:hypothetical protein